MQKLSHRTRAFFYNADQLKGFLSPVGIHEILKRISKSERKMLFKYHDVDMNLVFASLVSLASSNAQIEYLKDRLPQLAIFVMQRRGMSAELHEYS